MVKDWLFSLFFLQASCQEVGKFDVLVLSIVILYYVFEFSVTFEDIIHVMAFLMTRCHKQIDQLGYIIPCVVICCINPLNAELNPICHLLALLRGATIVVVSRLRVKLTRRTEFRC